MVVLWIALSGISPNSLSPLSYRLPIVTDPLAPLVSEIFDLEVRTSTQTDSQTSTLSDFKGRLKLSAREPIKCLQPARSQGGFGGGVPGPPPGNPRHC